MIPFRVVCTNGFFFFPNSNSYDNPLIFNHKVLKKKIRKRLGAFKLSMLIASSLNLQSVTQFCIFTSFVCSTPYPRYFYPCVISRSCVIFPSVCLFHLCSLQAIILRSIESSQSIEPKTPRGLGERSKLTKPKTN